MCGIFATVNYNELEELLDTNMYRGQHSFSISGFKINEYGDLILTSLNRSLGKFDLSQAPKSVDFYICHIQAPTGIQRGIDSVHPAEYNYSLLWHNGIIKEHDCERLRAKQKSFENWDTMLLLKELQDLQKFSDNANKINGSFACILYKPANGVYLFRNQLSPMFYGNTSLSSVNCNLATKSIPYETVYRLRVVEKKIYLITICPFVTFEQPYYFGGD